MIFLGFFCDNFHLLSAPPSCFCSCCCFSMKKKHLHCQPQEK